MTRRTLHRRRPRVKAAPPAGPAALDAIERLRFENMLTDRITGLKVHPLADIHNERIGTLGVIYLQLGRFSGVESLYGWELYDRVLRLTTESLREDLQSSPLKARLLSLQFNGCDGFYLLFDMPARANGGKNGARLEEEARRFRDGTVKRLRQSLGRTAVDLMSVHASCIKVPDDPRVRPSRHILRGLQEAARQVELRESQEKQALLSEFRALMTGRKLRAVYQPVMDIRKKAVLGYEALIRGPLGSELEMPDVLFAAAREAGLELELENLCLETIFGHLPNAVKEAKLFVNASSKFLAHSVFLDDRNLAHIKRCHPQVVMEISEKEGIWDYAIFREVLVRLRSSGLEIAIDDAGSGYSGLESILQMRPEYIKIANSIVHSLHLETIKREIITALASLGRQIESSIVAEGIEHPDELRSLLELGVNYGQGFLLGKPSQRIISH
jgi:EAL domain-containing protein (putative c-di-GMP-specific phosphodiesterase class I)